MEENLIGLVEQINQEMYEEVLYLIEGPFLPPSFPGGNKELLSFVEENSPLKLSSNGYAHSITFFGIQIWCSEDDNRPYENENIPEEDHIPLDRWIWIEIKRVLHLLRLLNKIYREGFWYEKTNY